MQLVRNAHLVSNHHKRKKKNKIFFLFCSSKWDSFEIMTAAVALLQCRRRSAWLLESSWSVFLLLGWILIRRGFLPFRLSPRAHIHTHTHKTSCVYGLSRPRPFATLISLVRRDSAHPKRENSPSRKRERESRVVACGWITSQTPPNLRRYTLRAVSCVQKTSPIALGSLVGN